MNGKQPDWQPWKESLEYLNMHYAIFYYQDMGPKGIKTFIKRVVRKLIRCVLYPILAQQVELNAHMVCCMNQMDGYINIQQEVNRQLQGVVEQQATELQNLSCEIQQLQDFTKEQTVEQQCANLKIEQLQDLAEKQAAELQGEKESVQRWQGDRDTKLQAIARDVVRTKWAFTDYMGSLKDLDEETVQCGICGYSGKTATLEKRITACIFGGGTLVRYICPQCGAIFGPIKFSQQSKEQFDDDYTVHYTGYHEGDSTEKEIRTFMQLKPRKDGIYLNYGCGSWSHSMSQLHQEGYLVYGYEPYSRNIDNPYIISDRAVLSKMRFNGIFSQDVLEHFADPVAELQFMKSLLATPDSLMAHTTGCYEYRYEYTRFHLFFFTGNSLDTICDKAGLYLLEKQDDPSDIGEKDYHCRVFGMKKAEIDYLHMANVNQFAEKTSTQVTLQSGGLCFGPYITLPKGEYHLVIEIAFPREAENFPLRITAQSGKRLLAEYRLQQGINHITFNLSIREAETEFVLENRLADEAVVTKLALTR